ncbi:uncharacterized protein CTRU02_211082 [Colletotrichum truncatum]|uniref:Uncharacterized protein n=1 Tax=Colletotrichum truncatum TaxID=5467 RepID=A0ACC3YQS9_COLTU|nr:uncharacterized protein CTRU02_01861 [Colletotrichum truncatum]KAF6798990.1 hypothetical protein CTRU02_01861 [Colletotrichum truncatum]
MATFAASTPSPPPTIRTPPTPRHGWSDNWEPYSPRKSARISSRRAANRTPSPQPSSHRTPPRTTRKAVAPSSSAAIMSPTATPQKKRQPAQDSVRRASGFLTVESASQAASSLGIDKMERPPTTTVSRRSGMLPTPAKTPKKAPTEKQTAHIRAVARNLFHSDDEALASPKRKRASKKYSGNSLESFTAEETEEPIEIFTDSQDRIPEADTSLENPFYGDSATIEREPPRRRSKRKVAIPGEASQAVDEAIQREDGMIYVFRGKKFFRKFAEPEDDEDEEGSSSESRLRRPLTRSAIKPRLLFPVTPKAPATGSTLEEEEAVTDIEDHHLEKPEDVPQTPVDVQDECPSTPQAPKFGPAATPPDTRRTTRSGLKSEEATPIKRKGRQSPFDDWPRVKNRHESTATKRTGDSLAGSAPKRART